MSDMDMDGLKALVAEYEAGVHYSSTVPEYAAMVALLNAAPALVAKVAAYEAFVAEVRDLRAMYVRDNKETLNTFSQHHPVARNAAEHLKQPFATLDAALGGAE